MYNRRFFRTRLGQASMASIAAMVAFVALSAQMQATVASATTPVETRVLVEMA